MLPLKVASKCLVRALKILKLLGRHILVRVLCIAFQLRRRAVRELQSVIVWIPLDYPSADLIPSLQLRIARLRAPAR